MADSAQPITPAPSVNPIQAVVSVDEDRSSASAHGMSLSGLMRAARQTQAQANQSMQPVRPGSSVSSAAQPATVVPSIRPPAQDLGGPAKYPPVQSVSVPGRGPEHHLVGSLVQEYIQASKPELALQPELKEYGVEISEDAETLQVTKQQQSVGIEPAKESVPVQTNPTGSVKLPLQAVSALQVKKTRPITESIRWLAELILEELKKAYQQGVKK